MTDKYPMEFRLTRCLRCSGLLTEHRRWTAEAIAATAGATYENPISNPAFGFFGCRCPVSPKCVGQWIGHDPMLWPERIAENKARGRCEDAPCCGCCT